MTDSMDMKRVKQLGDELLKSRKNANNCILLLKLMKNESSDELLMKEAIFSLHPFFLTQLRTGELIPHQDILQKNLNKESKKGIKSSENIYKEWIHDRYREFINTLIKFLQSSKFSLSLQSIVIDILMELVKENIIGKFNNVIFSIICLHLVLYHDINEETYKTFSNKYFKYIDIRCYLYSNIKNICQRKLNHFLKDQKNLEDDENQENHELKLYNISVYKLVRNVFSILLTIPNPSFKIKKDRKKDKLISNMENENENKILENWATITSDKKQKKEIVVDENQNKLDCKIWSLEKENGIFSASWLSFLKLPMPIDIYKKILMKLDSHILPHMSNTLLLSDFLTESYNQGGLVSIMSLNSLFILITRDGLEYPNFFNQLYSLLTPSIFFVKYRAKFFELLDKCLTSSHLPSYLIASFVKKLSRLSLTAPPHGVIVSLVFLHNCVRRHPSIGCLMHKIGDRKKTNQIKSKDEENEKKKNNKNEKNENGENSKRIEDENKDENGIEDESKDEKKDESKIEEEKKDETKIEEEKKDESKIEDENDGLNEQITNELSSNKINDKIGCDPFIWDETDVAKTNAIDSSLWEIETLKKHYCPAVSKFVSSFLETDLTQKTKTNEWVVSDFVFASYNTIISEELGKKLKQVPLAFYKNVPQTLFSKEDTFFKYGPKTNIDVFAGWAFAGETVTSEIQKDKSVIPYNQIGETREIKTESENRDEKVELVEKMEDGGSGDGEEEDAVEEEKEKMVAEKKGVVRVKRKREKNAGDLKKKSKINKV